MKYKRYFFAGLHKLINYLNKVFTDLSLLNQYILGIIY
jgi:hypothetical protein